MISTPILAAIVGTVLSAVLGVVGYAVHEFVVYLRLIRSHAEAAHEDASKSLRILRGEEEIDGDGLLTRVDRIEQRVARADGGQLDAEREECDSR